MQEIQNNAVEVELTPAADAVAVEISEIASREELVVFCSSDF